MYKYCGKKVNEMKKSMTWVFITVIAALYIAFITCDIFYMEQSKILKFISVCILALGSTFSGKEKENKPVTLIFLFTVVADIFFVLLNKPIYGIMVYIVIQLVHTVRLAIISKKEIKTEILKRVIPAVCLFCIGVFIGPVVALALPYAVCIGINIVHAIENNVKYPSRVNLSYAVAMLVLAVGDIGVGLRNIQTGFMTPEMKHVAYIVTWVTYIPSLVLVLTTTKALNFKEQR